ncbi:hypothetical protein K458DRAFT_412966 [Lentithecium fluviatile CBS 122367]|uniref:Uncharacterized protein n=1 Tax=Lentithecium fluviatile CBS 122367 TaxID=1168545 RepID=A0A6G1JJ01_9PLEO|nr:hypothetical protein K458DRAFT_412966 [Lentithecium fluviatile CBS 122367]
MAIPCVDDTPTCTFPDFSAFASTTDPETCGEWQFEGEVPSYLVEHAEIFGLDVPRCPAIPQMKKLRAEVRDPFGIQQLRERLAGEFRTASAALESLVKTRKRTYLESEEFAKLWGQRPQKRFRAGSADDGWEERGDVDVMESMELSSPPTVVSSRTTRDDEMDGVEDAPVPRLRTPSPILSFERSPADIPMANMPSSTSSPRKRSAGDMNADLSTFERPAAKKSRVEEGEKRVLRVVRRVVKKSCLGASLLLARWGQRWGV